MYFLRLVPLLSVYSLSLVGTYIDFGTGSYFSNPCLEAIQILPDESSLYRVYIIFVVLFALGDLDKCLTNYSCQFCADQDYYMQTIYYPHYQQQDPEYLFSLLQH